VRSGVASSLNPRMGKNPKTEVGEYVNRTPRGCDIRFEDKLTIIENRCLRLIVAVESRSRLEGRPEDCLVGCDGSAAYSTDPVGSPRPVVGEDLYIYSVDARTWKTRGLSTNQWLEAAVRDRGHIRIVAPPSLYWL
jgi:hypothetical protein